jgi:hypothetical protein
MACYEDNCGNACERQCNGCSDDCVGTCSVVCGGGCTGTCTSTCIGGCTVVCGYTCVGSCVNTCVGGCTVVCGYTCVGSCTGTCVGGCVGGCVACTGTCTGACDNACTSTSAAADISQLGSNVAMGNKIKVNDFISLRDSIHNELARRGKAIPADGYAVMPAIGIKIMIEHQQKIFNDINVMDPTKYKVITTAPTKASTIADARNYIQTLMSTNTKL